MNIPGDAEHNRTPPSATSLRHSSPMAPRPSAAPSSSAPFESATSAHAASSSASHGSPVLNPRSCVICRRRKVRCNKQYPCSNCAKAKVQCIFPAPERAKRRPRKPPDGELLTRLRRLEGVIQGMGMSVEDELAGSSLSSAHGIDHPSSPATTARGSIDGGAAPHSPSATLPPDFARLVVNEGKSRYVNNRFWTTVSNEVEDLKGILDETSDEEAELPSPSTDVSSPPPDAAFFFNYSSLAHDLHAHHPSSEHIWEYWLIYKDYVDPVIKMIHVPSIELQVKAVLHHPGKATKPMEAFLFAIYYSSVTALSTEECMAKFGESRDVLVRRYRFAVEQALARANFLISEELTVLQTFITFLICLRCHEDGRILWSLCGVVVRLAISMGLHRDGSKFGLPAFESEMRRRCWWQVVTLEFRSSQDFGIDPMIFMCSHDTQLPLNVNDEQLSPTMTILPEPAKGVTSMMFGLLRYDVLSVLSKLWSADVTFEEKEECITKCHQHLEDDYFKYCDMTQPLDWTICTVAKLIMARQFLLLYQPYIKTLPQSTIDRLFVTALDMIEFALRLENERKLVKWGWLFKTYNQWHALAFLLSELTRRTKGPLVQRAWRAVNSTLLELKQYNSESKRGQLWRPLIKLLNTAKLARERELGLDAQTLQNAQMRGQQAEAAQMTPQTILNGSNYDSSSTLASMDATGEQQGLKMLHMGNGDMYASDDVNINNLMMPALEPSLSHLSNPIDDQYLFDNTSNNVPTTSQFFANTPNAWPSQTMEQQYMMGEGDWFTNWGLDNTGASSNSSDATPGVFQQVMGQQPYGSVDPMVGGGDTGADMQYTDWDEVMKEFDAEAGAGQAARTQWSTGNPTLMGETWL